MAHPDPQSQNLPPHNDHESRPERCPCCGQSYPDARIWAPFVPRASGLLDLVLIAKDALNDLQAALEEEVIP
jgi:hypothetical protein